MTCGYLSTTKLKKLKNNDCEDWLLVDHFNTIKLIITGVNKIISAKNKAELIILQFNTLDIFSLSLQEGSKNLLLDQITTKINISCLCKNVGESIWDDFLKTWNKMIGTSITAKPLPLLTLQYHPHSNSYTPSYIWGQMHWRGGKCNKPNQNSIKTESKT